MDGLNKEQQDMHNEIMLNIPVVSTLPEPDRSRCLLGLAYEYFLLDMEEKGFELLAKADPVYFSKQLGEDMKTIPNMEEVVMRLLDKLMEIGTIVVGVKDEKN